MKVNHWAIVGSLEQGNTGQIFRIYSYINSDWKNELDLRDGLYIDQGKGLDWMLIIEVIMLFEGQIQNWQLI